MAVGTSTASEVDGLAPAVPAIHSCEGRPVEGHAPQGSPRPTKQSARSSTEPCALSGMSARPYREPWEGGHRTPQL
jgi:hypothetical protein